MKIFSTWLIGLLLATSSSQQAPSKLTFPKRQYVSHYENVLGTSLEIKITCSAEQQADLAEKAVLAEINRLSAILSSYDLNSEFNKWMRNNFKTPVKVSTELFQVLNLFKTWEKRTGGAISPAAAITINLWKEAERRQTLPSALELEQAIQQTQLAHYQLNDDKMTATRLSTVPLVMNSFAKSYIINKACDAALSKANINGIVVNVGGDLVVKGDIVDPVEITDPQASAENDLPLARMLIRNQAVATSGNYRRGLQIGNKWFSHIVDPRNGKPVERVISATIIAPNATDAGALATAFNVLTPKESAALAATVSGAEYLIITASGKRIESQGFKKLADLNHITYSSTNAKREEPNYAEKKWDPKFELLINFQLNSIADNGHRPFAAIWVEDANKVPVRNLALWYNKTKWLPDLRNWYRTNGAKFNAEKNTYVSVTGATRNPGKYTLKWDGKNDAGNYVAQGKYTIIIETAKEHGTNEILRQEMELKKTTIKASAAGNVEFSNVTFDFRKK